MSETKKVYAAINAVQAALSKTGITKAREAKDWGGESMYAFRGIDDVYNVVSPLLAENKLCIVPRLISRTSWLSSKPTTNQPSLLR